MARKLTITVSDDVYQGLYRVVGRRRTSRFLEDLAPSSCSIATWMRPIKEWLRTNGGSRKLWNGPKA